MTRKLSKPEVDFLEELDLYDQVLALTQLFSLNQQSIETNGRGVRGMKIFTRQTLTAISLRKLFPHPNDNEERDAQFWDIGSLASLTRNLMEGYISLHYFGIEKISESEADLRFQLLQLHRNIEWYNIRLKSLSEDEKAEFEKGILKQQNKIRSHPYLANLSARQRGRVLQWREMYKSKPEFEKEVLICRDLVEHYRFLSNLVHPLPLSIERTDNDRGRGIGSDIDVTYCLNCLMLARKYLAASTIGIGDYFPGLSGQFRTLVDQIRPLQSKGFEQT